MEKVGLVWLRNDLRVLDHWALKTASEKTGKCIILYCIPDSYFLQNPLGMPRVGAARWQFLLESLEDLSLKLQQHQQELWVLKGSLHHHLPKLSTDLGITDLFFHIHPGTEEEAETTEVEKLAFELKISTHSTWERTLYAKGDLPFNLSHLPAQFTSFRKAIEAESIATPSLSEVNSLPNAIKIPTFWNKAIDEAWKYIQSSGLKTEDKPLFKGGETAAWQRLSYFFWEKDLAKTYKTTRNGLEGTDFSCQISPYLAFGNISARQVYHEVIRYEQQRVKNEDTYWIWFELLWRDYFYWVTVTKQNAIFLKKGLKPITGTGIWDMKKFKTWKLGQTEQTFLNANMRFLAENHWLSNRGRQNAASYLVHQLGLDWRMGAYYFEHQLVDYDVACNWCNWAYIAGVGNDPRPQRMFNLESQAKQYDPMGHFTQKWSTKNLHSIK